MFLEIVPSSATISSLQVPGTLVGARSKQFQAIKHRIPWVIIILQKSLDSRKCCCCTTIPCTRLKDDEESSSPVTTVLTLVAWESLLLLFQKQEYNFIITFSTATQQMHF